MSGEFSPITTSPKEPVPRGWTWALLEDLARLESGHTPSRRVPEYWEGGDIPWLSLKDIQGLSGRYIHDTRNHPTQLGIDNSSARVLPAGTVAFCRTASVGKTVILGRDMATSQDFVNWICGPRLSPDYLYYAFRSSGAFFDQQKQGTTHKTIYFPTVKQFHVLLPPLPEQKRIAAILDKADAIRRKRQEAIRLTEELLRSAFLDMFGDPVTNPKGWEVKPLNDFIAPERPITYGILKPGPDTPNGVPYIRVVDIKDGEVIVSGVRRTTRDIDHEFRRSRLKTGDLLMSIRGHVGRLAIVPAELEGANITQDTARLAPVGLDSQYLMNLVQTPGIQFWMARHVRGVAVQGINIGDVRRIPVPVPPQALQRAFASLVQTTLHNKALSRTSLVASDLLADSLTQRAFSGSLQ